MAFDPGPCGPQFEDWEDAYNDWQNKDAAADAAARNAAAATATAVAVCGAAWWTGAGTVGCAVAAAAALYADGESIAATNARNEAAGDKNDAKAAYDGCVDNHKQYYK